MAKLYTINPDGVTVYTSRAPGRNDRAAASATTVKIALGLGLVVVGLLLLALYWFTSISERLMDGENQPVWLVGVSAILSGLFAFRGEFTGVEFRGRTGEIINKGLFFSRRIGSFDQIADVGVLPIENVNGIPVGYQCLAAWKGGSLSAPLALSAIQKDRSRLALYETEVVPAITRLLREANPIPGEVVRKAEEEDVPPVVSPGVFFTRESRDVYVRTNRFAAIVCALIAMILGMMAYNSLAYWQLVLFIGGFAVVFLLISLAHCTRFTVDRDARTVGYNDVWGLKRRVFSFSEIDQFLFIEMKPVYEIGVRLKSKKESLSIGAVFSRDKAKALLMEATVLLDVNREI